MNKPKQSSSHKNGTNFYGMIRDVLVTSLNKGQFPLALVFIIFIIIVFKLPSEDISYFLKKLFKKFEEGYILGWCLFMFCIIGWYTSNKYLRKIHFSEINRITQEKKYLQEDKSRKNK